LLCGHIHEARGIEKIKETLVLNPGPLYRGMGAIVVVEDKNIEAELLEV